MTKDWLTRGEAIEMVRLHLGSSIGRAEAVVRAAHASGEVRFADPNDPAPVLLTADDGVVGMSMRSGTQKKMGISAYGQLVAHETKTVRSTKHISNEDLLDWLHRSTIFEKKFAVPMKPEPKKRSQNKRTRAEEAIQAIWKGRPPAAALLPNGSLCKQVEDWIKADCKRASVAPNVPSDDTILRAAGRK